jgi:uncharacterized SAM-binding protein YcdF (DUF218 family)
MNVILELGGNTLRMKKAIELAQRYPDSKIVISSEGDPTGVHALLSDAGIADTRYIFDFHAWDTVTNFTETIGLVKSFRPSVVFVVTDKFHMRRAMAVARAAFFFTRIAVVPEPYLGSEPHDPEPVSLVRSDRFRAWLWRLTGYLKYYPDVKEARMPGIERDEQCALESGYPVNQ